MATAKKAAPAKKVAAKEEVVEATMEIGSSVKFLGYGDDVDEADRILTEGEVYEVVAFTEAEGDDPGGDPVVSIPNPDFNAKKKEHPETNPKMLDVQVFAEEVELVDGEEVAEEEVAEAAPAKPAGKAKVAAAAPAKAAAPAGKTKVAAAPAKAAGKTKAAPVKAAKAEAPPEEEHIDLLDTELENEDAEVLALLEGSDDLIVTAQELDSKAAAAEYQLGGVLYHIRKEKKYLEVEGGAAYAEKGGFERFLQEYFNVEYRKAMYLIKIYIAFNVAGIEDAAGVVSAMGWTKAMKIAPLMLVEGQNPEELIELANSSTVSDLSTAIMDSKRVGGAPGTAKKRLTLRFRYFEEEAATVNAILEAAKEQLSLKDIGEALAHIVQEWATEHGGGEATKAAAPAQKAVAAKKAVPARRVAA